MAEEKETKKKNTSSKKGTQKSTNNRKGQTSNRGRNSKQGARKTNSYNRSTSKNKKVATKKTTAKKVEQAKEEIKVEASPIKKEPKKIIPFQPEDYEEIQEEKVENIEPEVEKIEETAETKLEKTLIFDGIHNKNLDDVVDKIEEDNIVFDDKIIKRSKVKKCAIIVLILAILGIILATTAYVVDHERNTRPQQTLNSNIYKNVSKTIKRKGKLSSNTNNLIAETEYSNIKTITLNELEERIIDKENMIVLVASTTCYHCITFEPIINDAFKENSKTAYRINIASLSTEDIERFRTYYSFTVTPTLFKIDDGYVKSEMTGTSTKDELTEWLND